jgi:hypothetical protein
LLVLMHVEADWLLGMCHPWASGLSLRLSCVTLLLTPHNKMTCYFMQVLVLDEADRLLDMGFRPAIEAFFSKMERSPSDSMTCY